MQFFSLPFGYMYFVRLRKTPSRFISFFFTEWLPLLLVLHIVYSANLLFTLLLQVGSFTVYESGYFFNDLADSTADPGGDNLAGRRISVLQFALSHVLSFLIIFAIVVHFRGIGFALQFTYLTFAVLVIFIWHTTRRPRAIRFLRIFTFIMLNLYKFIPVIIAFVPLPDVPWLLAALFFCWGFWRSVFYIIRKFGHEEFNDMNSCDPLRLMHIISLVGCAPLLLMVGWSTQSGRASCMLWVTYVLIASLRFLFQLSPWKLTPDQGGVFLPLANGR